VPSVQILVWGLATRALLGDEQGRASLRSIVQEELIPVSAPPQNLWKDNRAENTTPSAREVAQDPQYVMHWRLGHEVESQELRPAEAQFFGALRQGQSLGQAAELALSCSSEFDISLVFAGALEAGVFDATQPSHDQKGE
jgi:hypothetical protein